MATKEKPTLIGFRLYKRHRVLVKKLARIEHVSQAQIVRDAIERLATGHKGNDCER